MNRPTCPQETPLAHQGLPPAKPKTCLASDTAFPPPTIEQRAARDKHFWTTTELKIVTEIYPLHGMARCLQVLPRRSATGIYSKACKLGLKAPGVQKQGWARRRWSNSSEIDERIRRVYQEEATKNAVNELVCRLGRPRWWVSKRAAKLGLAVPRFKEPDWSEPEHAILERNAHKSPEVIARTLARYGYRRTVNSIVNKIKRRNLDTIDPDRFTAGGLASLMGVDAKTVTRWIQKGWLKAKRRGTARTEAQGGDQWWIHRREIHTFVRDNAAAVDLRKVDKYWFIDLLAGPAS